MKNLLFTKTAIGAYGSLIALFIALAPQITSIINRHTTDANRQADVSDVVAIIVGIAGSLGAITGRYGQDTYTPKGLPGKDKP